MAKSYEEALAAGIKTGAAHCAEPELMAMFVDSAAQTLIGPGVSPKLLWQGAQKKGLTTLELAELISEDALKASELMWVEG
jgi:hypothetical protein